MAAKKTTKKAALKFSPNKKLNYVLKDIHGDILEIIKEDPEFVKDSKRMWPREIDFNIAQNGNLLVYYEQVRNLYKKAGYSKTTLEKMSDDKLWDSYRRNVGYVARNYF